MSLHLDPSQLLAVRVSPDTRQIVVAGPGSGKTEVVAALVQHHIAENNVDPRDELLTLSFSRAAVHAVARRLRDDEAIATAPPVRTLDSLATEILTDAELDPTGMDFDQRVTAARMSLRQWGWHVLDAVAHVIVDEVQDVVGVRADFLLAILEALPPEAGFTLLGDPAQAIYDFQLVHGASTSSTDLLSRAESLGPVRRVELTGQYRANTREIRNLVALRESVLGGSHLTARRSINAVETALVPIGDIADAATHLPRWTGTTAFLTRTNGQALLVAEELWKLGVPATVRRPATEGVIAPWLAQLVAETPTTSFDRTEFEAAGAGLLGDGETVGAWRAVRSVARPRGPRVDAAALAAALAGSHPVPGDLLLSDQAPVVVSTVHRAKGLEFENVVLVGFPDERLEPDIAASPEEARRLYVASTRARSRIGSATGPKVWNLRKDGRTGRWYLRGPKDWQTWGFQIKGDDVDRRHPAGPDHTRVQQHLSTVRVGDPLALALDRANSTLDLPVYAVMHEGIQLATTSPGFGAALAGRVRPARSRDRGRVQWPALSGAHVETVETVAGSPQPSTDGVGRSGLWLGVRAGGMLRLSWKDDADG